MRLRFKTKEIDPYSQRTHLDNPTTSSPNTAFIPRTDLFPFIFLTLVKI